jgi:uncharacterized delta-60 repeat protein
MVVALWNCDDISVLTAFKTAEATPLTLSQPTFSPDSGTYNSDQSITVSSSTSGATIYYTTDGSAPSTSSKVYGAPIPVTGDATAMTIQAIAAKSGMNGSTAAQASYTIHYSGSLDTDFAAGAGANSFVYAVAAQSDGKILIGGNFSAYNGTSRGYIARLLTDGSLDTGFATGAGANGFVYAVAVQSDGKIIIGGNFNTYDGTSRVRVARLLTDGSLDTGFATGVGANGVVYSVAVQSDGKIIIGGNFNTYNGTSRGYVARLNTNGTLDNGFAPGAGANGVVYSVAVQSDGNVLIGGSFTTYNGTSRGHVARLNTDGSLDIGFATGVGAMGSGVNAVAVQSDGNVLIGGIFPTYNGISRGCVARLLTDGSLDTGFATGAGAGNQVSSVAVQSDGKILIGGTFTTYDGTSRGYVARLLTDGSLDTGFLATGAGTNTYVNSAAVQSDGKIIIGGQFTTYNGTSRGYLARVWN